MEFCVLFFGQTQGWVIRQGMQLLVASALIATRRTAHAAQMSEQSSQRFSVYLESDDHNMREYVSRVLMMVCEVSASEATAIIKEANRDRWKNRALCGAWEEQIARHVYIGLTKAGLSAVILGPGEELACHDLPLASETYPDGSPIESEEDLPRYYQ